MIIVKSKVEKMRNRENIALEESCKIIKAEHATDDL